MCLDYGARRTGIAVTDPLQIIATGLPTIESKTLPNFIKSYFSKEQVELLIIGLPKNLDGTDTDATPLVKKLIEKLNKEFPTLKVKTVDEQFTSSMAKKAMLEMGMKKKERRIKGNVDEIAAVLMLQEYMNSL